MTSLEKLRSNAMRGKWSDVFQMYRQEKALRTARITATGDTVLHMVVSNCEVKVAADIVDFLVEEEKSLAQNNEEEEVVVTMDRDGEENWNVDTILGAENDKKNTPLHLAARMGHVETCKKIGRRDPSLIVRHNMDGETPLFLATLSGSKEAFLWLYYLCTPGDSSADFAHCIRGNDDTILHCAIAEGHIDVAIEIVYLYKDHLKKMTNRNKEGLSPLHLLASKRSAFKSTELLEVPTVVHPIYWLWKVEEKNHATKLEELNKKSKGNILVDIIKGIGLVLLFLPLLLLAGLMIFLALFLRLTFSEAVIHRWCRHIPKMKQKHTWSHQIMTKLLQHASDEVMSQIISRAPSERLSISLQTKKDNEISRITIETPLMIAAKNGVTEMVEKILELFPLRIKDVNAEGKNILLLAVENRQTKVFKFLCKQKWLTESLFGQVDKDENNALHLAAGLGVEPNWLNPGEALSMGREINWYMFVQELMPYSLSERYNRKMETPEDIFRESHKELLISEEEWVLKTSEACSVVSTLVVSVAYATRTNVPSGYDDNGYAIRRNEPPEFKTFKDYSFAALFFSLIATICFLSIVASRSQSVHYLRYIPSKFSCGVYFMLTSIICLWVSFCAADFFMLSDHSRILHKPIPTYIFLSSMIIFMVVSQLPIFLGPKLSRILWTCRIPDPRRKATRPIEYRRTKNEEKGTNLNRGT